MLTSERNTKNIIPEYILQFLYFFFIQILIIYRGLI